MRLTLRQTGSWLVLVWKLAVAMSIHSYEPGKNLSAIDTWLAGHTIKYNPVVYPLTG